MKNHIKRRIPACIAVLLILALTSAMGITMRQTLTNICQEEADHILHAYNESVIF